MPPEVTTAPEVVEVTEYEQVQANTRLAAINVLSSDGPVEVTENLHNKPAEVLAMMQRLASAAGMTVQFGRNSEQSESDSPIKAVVDEAQGEKRALAPEVQARLLTALQGRFDANTRRHEGVEWADVQRSLEANPEALWSLQQMEENGHAPDVYMEDNGAYYFGTCSVETPESARNIVYDAEAEAWLAENRPQETCNGNAVDIAAAMGIDLMDGEQYKHLQTLGRFDAATRSWLKTLDAMRKRGDALFGYRVGGNVYVRHRGAYDRYHDGAFRGSLRVSKA